MLINKLLNYIYHFIFISYDNIINLLVKGNLYRFISLRVMTINYTTTGNFIRK